MSTTDVSCLGLGGEEGTGEDNGGCDDDGWDDDGCESVRTLLKGLPARQLVGARLRPRLPAVSDSLRGGLDASVRPQDVGRRGVYASYGW